MLNSPSVLYWYFLRLRVASPLNLLQVLSLKSGLKFQGMGNQHSAPHEGKDSAISSCVARWPAPHHWMRLFSCNYSTLKTINPSKPPGLLQESLGPFRPEVSPRVFPENGGVSEGVSDGVSPGSLGPGSGSKSVPSLSPECRKGVPDTAGRLPGHFLDTPEPADTLGDIPETLWARRARETPVAGQVVRKTSNPREPGD